MADLTSASVSVLRTSSSTLSNGLTQFEKTATVTLTAMGTVANKVLASAFGLSSFEDSSMWTQTDNTIILVAAPASDRTYLLMKAAGTNAPADASGAFNCVVRGY